MQAIARLGEKALQGGGKSEDQPSSGNNATSPRCMVMVGATFILLKKAKGRDCYVQELQWVPPCGCVSSYAS
jgi:hypothetical protein